jgi:archaellum component FlaC
MASSETQDLLREMRELRETVAALRQEMDARQRVTLRVLQEGPFLGQPVNVVAAVTNARGEPRVDVPVTLIATWGRLRAVEGFRLREESGVTARTDGEGTARVVLLPPTSGDVSPAHQDALEVALRLLDRAAPTPREAAAGLRELARQYRLDGNVELRQAMDLYFQELGQRYREAVESRIHAVWSTFDTTVFAFARDAEPGDEDVLDTAVLATAALPLRFKDWIGPWLQAMAEVAQEESGLEEELRNTRQRTRGADTLVGHVYGRLQLFLEGQKGIAGELTGRRAAESSLRGFLSDGLPDLPADARAGVLRGVEAASGTLKTSGAGVLAAVGQTRTDLTRTIDRKIEEVPTVDLSGVTGRLDQLAGQISVKADRSTVEALTTSVNNVTRDLTTVRNDVRQVSERVGRLGSDLTVLGTDLNGKLAAKADAETVTQLTATVNTKADQSTVNTLSANVTNLNRDVGALKETSTRLNDRVTNLDTSVNRLDTNLRDVQGRFGPIIGPIGPIGPVRPG